MFNKLTYQQRFLTFAGIACFFIVIFFKISVLNSYDQYVELEKTRKEVVLMQAAPNRLNKLKKEIKTIETILAQRDVNDPQDNLLATISPFCKKHQIAIRKLPRESVVNKSGYQIYTTELIVEGSYTDLVQLAYELEYVKKIGRISGMQFSMERDTRTKRQYLEGIIYLQRISKNSNNEVAT